MPSRRTMLVFFFAPDCDDCAGLKPEVVAFAQANPDVDVRKVDIYEKELGSIDPPGVPSFLVRYADGRVKTLMPTPVTAKQLSSWVAAGGGKKP